ncbi:Uncharacterised protein [Staphylococcus aureus]|nr:Uncharacterised protein [Staphylococcus aureus]
MFFGLNLRQTNANTTIVASDGIISASSGPWNIVNNNCNPVYVPLTVKMTGKISLIPFIPSTMNTKTNGIIKFKIGSVNAEYLATSNVVTPPLKLNVSIILTGKPIAPKAPAAPLAIKHNIAAFNGSNPS